MIRHTLLGIGITLVVFSLVLLGTDYQFQQEELVFEKEEQVEQEDIISKARELGMTFSGENYQKYNSSINLQQEVDLEKVLIDLAEEEEVDKIEQEKEESTAEVEKLLEQEELEVEEKNDGEVIEITIPEGMPSRQVATLLVEQELIEDRLVFIQILDKLDSERKVMAGTYQFSTDISPLRLLLTLLAQ
ncbi:endolytic transglycosylase MltG [Natroniella acetigena]|uniref:endolytic transglycosylase MltG n=1 Tax=Natroniella acetigena TaxID=52004 RepID=UPI00200A4E1C|nr:endolytic transglycosylase MltG [Natroniella acetigena]MCK8826286.1 endolytic transglycosylase MltG [Natroniella acetigena]